MSVTGGSVTAIALQQKGIKELTGHNDGADIAKFTGGRQEPWCAHYVAWVFRSAGKPIPGDVVPTPTRANPLASVSFMQSVFEQHGWMVKDPQPGDVVFFKVRGASDAGSGKHVGIVTAVSPPVAGATKWTVSTVEGNMGDKVGTATYPIDSPLFLGFGRRP